MIDYIADLCAKVLSLLLSVCWAALVFWSGLFTTEKILRWLYRDQPQQLYGPHPFELEPCADCNGLYLLDDAGRCDLCAAIANAERDKYGFSRADRKLHRELLNEDHDAHDHEDIVDLHGPSDQEDVPAVTRSGPTLEGSLAEWQTGEVSGKWYVKNKLRMFLWRTLPPEIIATGLTGGFAYCDHKLGLMIGNETVAEVMTRLGLLGIPGMSTTIAILLMYGMHLAAETIPTFTEVISPFGPRRPPNDLQDWEDWLDEGVRIGRWQALDGSGRAGAIARIPIIDEHIFIAALTRHGKSTCEWQIMDDLKEAIDSGAVRVIMIDPKNGMEMATAVNLGFVRKEDFYWGENVGEPNNYDSGSQALMIYEETFIKPLEDLVREMRRRADKIRFHSVHHRAKPGDPHIIVIIDELAQLVRATTPTPIKNRINNAILTLLNQGAACGITVIGCTQHPSVEEVGPIRNGFTFKMGGRLSSARAVDMVLGDEARRRGSKADKLHRKIRGVFFTSACWSDRAAGLQLRSGVLRPRRRSPRLGR